MKRFSHLVVVVGLVVLAGSTRASAESCPGFPARAVEVIDQIWNPTQANGDDDARRALTRSIVEQLAYEFPGAGWVWKSADKNRPPSKDGIARQVGATLCAWDWQNGGTRRRSVQVDQVGEDITGQYPIVLAGVNHLGAPAAPGTTPSTPSTPDPALVARVAALEQALQALAARLPNLEQAIEGARGAEVERIGALDAKVDSLAQTVTGADDRISALEARPIPAFCEASIDFGVARAPIRCRLK